MRALVFVVFVACGSSPASVVPASSPSRATLGDTFTVESKILGEQRTINVYVPPDYDKSQDRFPVLYMPDGGMAEDFPHVVGSVDVSIKNAIIRPVIVVGVQNTERRRDLPGPTVVPDEREAAPKAGGSDKFRAFFRDELKPLIAQRYRTTAESALIGESLGGLFAVETLLVEPALFDAYIAADPSLWWNEQSLVRTVASTKLAWWTAGPKQLYIATADHPPMLEAVAILERLLSIDAPPITYKREEMPDEHHGSIFPRAALRGIRWVFAAPSP
jgi:uncharacterized protein